MKKSTFFAAAAIAVAFVGGLASCSNNQQGQPTSVVAFGGDSITLPIAYINTDSLLTNYEFAKDLNEALIKKTEDARADINSQAASREKEVNDFQRKVQTNAFLSEDRAQSEANRLQAKKDQLDQLNYKLQNDLAQEQAQMNARLSDTIHAVLKEYNAVKKFELILSNTMYDNILLDNPKYDITGEILQILNDRYAKSK